MKKILFLFALVALTLGVILYGCGKTDEPVGLKDPSRLSDDKEFVQIAGGIFSYTSFLVQTIKKNRLTTSSLGEQLSELQSKKVSSDEQMTAIEKMFKQKMSSQINERVALQSRWISLKSMYKPFSEELLKKEMEEVFKAEFAKRKSKSKGFVQASEGELNCGWAFYACAAGASAVAFLCAGGCTVATGGVGIVACIIACDIIHGSGLAICFAEWC